MRNDNFWYRKQVFTQSKLSVRVVQIAADENGHNVPYVSFHDVTVPLSHMIGDVGEATALAELNNRKLNELYENDGKMS